MSHLGLLMFGVALLATGSVSGVLAGLLGVGGGIVVVPVFAVVALLVAVYMAFRREGWIIAPQMPDSLWVRGPLGLAIGGLSVLMGIGGGTLGVPAFSAFGCPSSVP